MTNFLSKKLYAFTLAILVLVLNKVLALELPPESIIALMSMVIAYIVGQSTVDVVAKIKAK